MCMWITQESSQICGLSFSRSAWGWRVCISSKLRSAVLPSCRCTGHAQFVQQVFTIEAPLGIHNPQVRVLCLRKSTEQGEIWGWVYGWVALWPAVDESIDQGMFIRSMALEVLAWAHSLEEQGLDFGSVPLHWRPKGFQVGISGSYCTCKNIPANSTLWNCYKDSVTAQHTLSTQHVSLAWLCLLFSRLDF